MHRNHGEIAVRRILGVLALAKKYGVASTDDACAVALETGACEYHFVRRYLEHNPQLPLSLRQVDPLIRQLTLYRDLIENRTRQENRLMNVIELERALRQLRLGGMAAVLETRLRQAQAEAMAPIDLISCLVSDELTRRTDRLLERRRKQAGFRDPDRTLDNFDFTFNPKMNRSLVFDLATGAFISKREDALFLGPGGTGKSHLAQAIGQAAIQQGYKVLYRETHVLLDELADAVADGTRKEYMESVATVPLLIIDDFGMRKLPHTAAEDLLEIIMRRYERFSTLLTSNRPVEDWGKLLGDVAAVSAMLDRLLHHGHVLKCGPRSWRTKTAFRFVRNKTSYCEGAALALPGFIAFPASMSADRAARWPPGIDARTSVGARVPSLESPVLRSGITSITLQARSSIHKRRDFAPKSGALARSITQRWRPGDIAASPKLDRSYTSLLLAKKICRR